MVKFTITHSTGAVHTGSCFYCRLNTVQVILLNSFSQRFMFKLISEIARSAHSRYKLAFPGSYFSSIVCSKIKIYTKLNRNIKTPKSSHQQCSTLTCCSLDLKYRKVFCLRYLCVQCFSCICILANLCRFWDSKVRN